MSARKSMLLDDKVNKWTIAFCNQPITGDTLCSECVIEHPHGKPGEIKIQGNLSPNEIKIRLLHALVHCCERTTDICFDDTDKHYLIDSFCLWFIQMLELNPKIATFLFKK